MYPLHVGDSVYTTNSNLIFFHFLQCSLYTTVAILDRFLQVELGSVSRNKLQFVGLAAMLVAAKFEEV